MTAAALPRPLRHYLEFGWSEGREPSAVFVGRAYLKANPDVAASGMNPLVHFVLHGALEGRPLALPVAAPMPPCAPPVGHSPDAADEAYP